MENNMTEKEKEKDVKIKDGIRMGNYGENKDEIKLDARNKLNHIAYDPKADTRNAQNTVSPR